MGTGHVPRVGRHACINIAVVAGAGDVLLGSRVSKQTRLKLANAFSVSVVSGLVVKRQTAYNLAAEVD
jgi:hypothetical protein